MINAPVRRMPPTTHQPETNAPPALQDIRLNKNPGPPVATSQDVVVTPSTNNVSVPVTEADQSHGNSSREHQPATEADKVPPAQPTVHTGDQAPAVPQPQGLRGTDVLLQEASGGLDQPQGAHGGVDLIQEHREDVTHAEVHRGADHLKDVQRGPAQDY